MGVIKRVLFDVWKAFEKIGQVFFTFIVGLGMITLLEIFFKVDIHLIWSAMIIIFALRPISSSIRMFFRNRSEYYEE